MARTLFDAQGNVQIVSSTVGYDMAQWTDAGDTPQAVLENPAAYVWSSQFNAFVAAPAPPINPPAWQSCINFHADATASITLAALPLAPGFLAGSNRNIEKIDMALFTQACLRARVMTAGASGSKLVAVQASSLQTAIGSYSDLGVTAVEAAISAAGIADSGWINLAQVAIGNGRFVTIRQEGGNGVASPALGRVTLWLR